MALKKNEWWVICWVDPDDHVQTGPVDNGWWKTKKEAMKELYEWERYNAGVGEFVVVKFQLPDGVTPNDIYAQHEDEIGDALD